MIDWKYSDELTKIANDLEATRKEIYVHSKDSKEDYEGIDEKLNIRLYDSNGNCNSFVDVMKQLSNMWDCLSNDYKDKLYETIGILCYKDNYICSNIR